MNTTIIIIIIIIRQKTMVFTLINNIKMCFSSISIHY